MNLPAEAFRSMSPLDLHVLSTPPAFVLSQDQTLHKKVYLLPFQARSLLRRALWLFYFNLNFQSILLEFKDFFGRFRDLSLFWLRHCSVLKDLVTRSNWAFYPRLASAYL